MDLKHVRFLTEEVDVDALAEGPGVARTSLTIQILE